MNIVLLMYHEKLQLPCLGSCWPTEDEGEEADGGGGVDEHRGEREEEARAGARGLRKKIFPSIL